MNFLSSNCLVRYGRVKFWTMPCCRDILKWSQHLDSDDKSTKAPTHTKSVALKTRPKQCLWNWKSTGFIQWTQVRYQKDCPRLHRDLEFPNFDDYRKKDFKDPRKTSYLSADKKYGFAYVVSCFGVMAGMYGMKAHVIHYVTFMGAAADVLAMATAEIDLSSVAPGGCLTYKWRGKPLFIKNRTAADIALEAVTPMSELKDPETVDARAPRPEWLVVIGVCTHLGCVPIPNSGDYSGGFYCPCHGSHYDNAGRARRGPAPTNLEIPPYKFLSDTMVLVG